MHVPPPHCRRCPFGQQSRAVRLRVRRTPWRPAIRTATSGKPAAMFVEPVQGNGGIMVPPPEYFPKLREVLNRYGTLLIADEVQTGFGRTGRMFAMEHWDVTPDIITGGKALGGGTPVGFLLHDRRDRRQLHAAGRLHLRRQPGDGPGRPEVPGDPAAGRLWSEHSARLGVRLQDRLKKLAEKSDMIFGRSRSRIDDRGGDRGTRYCQSPPNARTRSWNG